MIFFWNLNFEIRVGGDGRWVGIKYRQSNGGLESTRSTWSMWPQVAKSGPKYRNLNGMR